ncbi:MAG TPA: hypothetical protein VGQ33_06715, partial [Vicinamibacteria bacterium]|nr:hypothetical protein [Vicinamibacteria bacterium]
TAVLVVASAGSLGAAPAHYRFVDLERLYFQRIIGRMAAHPSVARSLHAIGLKALLPESLRPADRHWEIAFPDQADAGSLSVQDFRVPLRGRELVLREVEDSSARLTEQWWVLYAKGHRTDAWYFVPDPARMDNKLLTDLSIGSVDAPRPGLLVLHVSGSMLRPAGAWWVRGAELTFSAANHDLRLARVSDRYFASRDYDRGEGEPPISVRTYGDVEEAPGALSEVRSYDAVPSPVLKQCAGGDGGIAGDAGPVGGKAAAAEPFDPSDPIDESTARCITATAGATVERQPATPSLIERGAPPGK